MLRLRARRARMHVRMRECTHAHTHTRTHTHTHTHTHRATLLLCPSSDQGKLAHWLVKTGVSIVCECVCVYVRVCVHMHPRLHSYRLQGRHKYRTHKPWRNRMNTCMHAYEHAHAYTHNAGAARMCLGATGAGVPLCATAVTASRCWWGGGRRGG